MVFPIPVYRGERRARHVELHKAAAAHEDDQGGAVEHVEGGHIPPAVGGFEPPTIAWFHIPFIYG